MSDTPRTDEQINGKPCTRFDILAGDSLRNASVQSEFARGLERELNEIERLAAVRLSYIKLIEAQNDAANDRIKRLEDRIHRAAMAFFRDGSDGQVASQMLQILEEERGKQ